MQENYNIQDSKSKQQTLESFLFIHQILTQRTSYYLEELTIADKAARIITKLCNKLSDDIQTDSKVDTAEAVSATEAVSASEPVSEG